MSSQTTIQFHAGEHVPLSGYYKSNLSRFHGFLREGEIKNGEEGEVFSLVSGSNVAPDTEKN